MRNPTNKAQTIDVRRYGLVGVIGGIVLLALACIRIVPANTVGIPTTFGAIGAPVSPGLKLVAPFTEVNTFSTRLQESTMLADVDEGDRRRSDSIEVRGSDGYAMNVDLTIRFAVRPESASMLYRRVGDMVGIRDRIVRPETREGVRVVFGNFTAEEGYTAKREQISSEVNEVMRKRLEPYGLDLDQVNIRNVNPEESLRKAIGDRAAARERANQAQIEQQKQVTEAETRRQVAERDAQARQISAQAEADANARISASLTDPLLRKLYFEALAKETPSTSRTTAASSSTVASRPPGRREPSAEGERRTASVAGPQGSRGAAPPPPTTPGAAGARCRRGGRRGCGPPPPPPRGGRPLGRGGGARP